MLVLVDVLVAVVCFLAFSIQKGWEKEKGSSLASLD